jgi:hypothetical protein
LTVGVDLGDQWSHYCILGLEGETLAEGQLRTTQEKSGPGFWLVGDGVQGAFLLDEEKVRPAYMQGALWREYSGSGVSGFLANLDALKRGQH